MADLQTTLDKWVRNTQAGIPSYKAGVMAVTVAPTQKAAQQAQYYAQQVQAAVDSGRYQAGLQAVSLQDWQQAATGKGANRIAAGVQAAQPKVQAFLTQFLPFVASVKQRIASMPKGGTAEADARMLAAVQLMRTFKFQKRTG
jgi:hypothetical protein